jgi:hypothetical protein
MHNSISLVQSKTQAGSLTLTFVDCVATYEGSIIIIPLSVAGCKVASCLFVMLAGAAVAQQQAARSA